MGHLSPLRSPATGHGEAKAEANTAIGITVEGKEEGNAGAGGRGEVEAEDNVGVRGGGP